jgi:FMN phosphatase YigB (HAD superfamily)
MTLRALIFDVDDTLADGRCPLRPGVRRLYATGLAPARLQAVRA